MLPESCQVFYLTVGKQFEFAPPISRTWSKFKCSKTNNIAEWSTATNPNKFHQNQPLAFKLSKKNFIFLYFCRYSKKNLLNSSKKTWYFSQIYFSTIVSIFLYKELKDRKKSCGLFRVIILPVFTIYFS